MKPIRVILDSIEESKRINALKIFNLPIRPYDIEGCVRRGGIVLDEFGDIALTNPFKENSKYGKNNLYPGMTICGGEIVQFEKGDENQPTKRGVVVIDFHPNRRYEQLFNLAVMKTVQIQIMEYDLHRDPFGPFTRIRRARLVPNLDEIQITEMRKLDRNKQPSVMLI